MLDEFMLSLNTEVRDGSIEEIAEKLMVMHEECLEGNFDSIKKLWETNTPTVSYIGQPSGNDEEASENNDGDGDGDDTLREDSSSEMEVDDPQCQSSLNQKDTVTDDPGLKGVPEVVDGWTVVSSRRSGGIKN